MRICSVLFVLGWFFVLPALSSGQEKVNQQEMNQDRIFSIDRFVNDAMFQIEDAVDWVHSSALVLWTNRDLMQRCGRYWVDNYSRLIAPDNREIGIWGIDSPPQSQYRSMLKTGRY